MDDAASHEGRDSVVGDVTRVEDDETSPEVFDAPAEEPMVEPDSTDGPELGLVEPEPMVEPEPLSLDELVAGLSDEAGSEQDENLADTVEAESEAADDGSEGSVVVDDAAALLDQVAPWEPAPVVSRLWTRVPFWLLGVVWAGFIGTVTYLLWPASSEPFVASPLYSMLVFGGAGLVALGFVMGLFVWVIAWFSAGTDGRVGLFRTVWMRALGWTTGGVVLWWIALVAMDMHRSGVIR